MSINSNSVTWPHFFPLLGIVIILIASVVQFQIENNWRIALHADNKAFIESRKTINLSDNDHVTAKPPDHRQLPKPEFPHLELTMVCWLGLISASIVTIPICMRKGRNAIRIHIILLVLNLLISIPFTMPFTD